MNSFQFNVIKQHDHTAARIARISTPHGEFITPAFMPVGTRAGVNNMTPKELQESGTQIILGGNTYHMLCAPGMPIIESAKGMHHFMGWHGPMLTDSGGFQVFSLSKQICTIDEQGAHFKIPSTDRLIHMTPEMSLETQKIIGADIIMAFDQCTPDDSSREEVQKILNRTHRWLKQSVDYHEAHPYSHYGLKQALFGIIQGGIYEDLRKESADFVCSMPLDGIAIGGETIGFNMPKTVEILKFLTPLLPKDKPRYTMGVGMFVQDLFDVVAEGIDMFDCVAPTRNARHGVLYSGKIISDGKWLKFDSEYPHGCLQIRKSYFANDMNPIMDDCRCYTCRQYSRAFLHYLFKQKTTLYTALASIHNIAVLQEACARMRTLILE